MANLDLRPAHLPITVYYKGDVSMQFSFTSGGVLYPLTSVTAANFVISEKNGTTAINLSSGSGLTITSAAGTIDLAITHAQIVALATQEYNYEFYLTLSGGDVWPILDSFFNVSEDGQVSVTSSDVSVSLDGSNVDVSIVAPTVSGGGTWGSITGTLSDQTDLQSALDAKAATSHTHALSALTQSSATSGQVPKWNGTAWAAATDSNGVYSGSGTIPDGTAASLEADGQFTINYANTGLPALWAIDNNNIQLRSPDGNVRIQVDNDQAEIESAAGFRLTIDGSSGTAGQVPTAQGDGTTLWEDAAGGGGASITDITYADMQTAITGGTLTEGAFYRITDAAGTDLGFVCQAIKTNEITVNGTGGYLNADFQAAGDYTGVEAVTGVVFMTPIGIWRTGFEVITIPYTNLSGGTFTVGDTITGGTSGATAVIVTDDGASSMTAYMTSAGVAFDGSEVLDNEAGVTADQGGAAGTPTIVQGDVVIWNLLHWQLTDATLLDGTDPETNTAAYTQLLKTDAGQGYVTAWDVSEFDFQNNWLQYRADIRGNKISYTFLDETNVSLGANAVSLIQWGNSKFYGNTIKGGYINQRNSLGTITGCTLTQYASIYDNILDVDSGIYGIYLDASTINECVFVRSYIDSTTMFSSLIVASSFADSSISKCTMFSNSGISRLDANLSEIAAMEMSANSQFTDIILGSGSQCFENKIFPSGIFSFITIGENGEFSSNIIENGAQLTGITAGANCSISRNKIGQGATLGGDTTMGDVAELNDNNLSSNSQAATLTLGESAVFSVNDIGADSAFNEIIIGDNCGFSANKSGGSVSVSAIEITNSGGFSANTFASGAEYQNKVIDGISFSLNYIATSINEPETISAAVYNKRAESGFSNFSAIIDITGLTTLDCLAANNYVGIFNLTSSNATEAIDTITNPPTAFPFTIRPAAGLVLTITGTAYSGIAAGQIALKATDYVLDGDKGEYIVLEVDPRGTGCLVEKLVVNGLI